MAKVHESRFKWITWLWQPRSNGDKTVDAEPKSDHLVNPCRQCGAIVVAKSQQPKLYCNQLCYQRFKRARQKPAPRKAIACLECGDMFVPIRDNHQRCGRQCRYVNQRRYMKANMSRYRPVPERKACAHCGQMFTPVKHTELYCTQRCKKSADYRPLPKVVIKEHERSITDDDLNTSAHAKEIAAYKKAGGKIVVITGLPNPKVNNINIGVKVGKTGEGWSAKDIADLDEYEDVVNLTNNFIGEKNV